jgi:hypothetical protein
MSEQRSPRHSIAYFPSGEGSVPATGHGWFLARDIPLGIMPLRRHRSGESFEIALTPDDDQRAKWLMGFLHIGQHKQRTVEDAVIDFVDTAAMYIGLRRSPIRDPY